MITERVRDWSGRLYIDGKDAFVKYGVFVLKGEYKKVVEMPTFKKFDSTEWDEYDGIEVDLSEPKLNCKSVQIEFGIVNVKYLRDLIETLSDGAYHTFKFSELGGLTKTYRFEKADSLSSFGRLGKGKITFYDDFTHDDSVITDFYEEGETEVTQRGYKFSDLNVDLCQCGVWVLDDSDDSIIKPAQVRTALKTDSRNEHGLVYDAEEVRFKTKDVTLKLLIHTNDVGEFFIRWSLLFYGCLFNSGERDFYFKRQDETYKCYYKSNSVNKFEILRNGHVWCEFSVVLCFTSLAEYEDFLLATEDLDWVITEDGELIRI